MGLRNEGVEEVLVGGVVGRGVLGVPLHREQPLLGPVELERLDDPVVEMHHTLLGHMSPEQLNSLIQLLALARDGVIKSNG